MGWRETIGIDTHFSNYILSDNSIVRILIYDNAGQERFRKTVENFYKGADAIILIYDICYIDSFESCKNYYCETIKKYCKDTIKVMLIGNKTDLEYQRKISFEEAHDFAFLNEYTHMETSCLRNENVYEAFEKVIEMTSIEKKKEKEKEKEKENQLKELKKKGCI